MCMKDLGECFYGSVTVGERGQIVIPAEARADLDIKPGEKLLILRHPVHNGLMVAKLEETMGFFEEMNARLQNLKSTTADEDNP